MKMAALTMRLDDLVEKRVRCPLCSEKILAAARKCKHCGEFISSSRDEAAPPPEAANIAADEAADGDAREGDSHISMPLLAALLLMGGGAIVLGVGALGAHRPAAEAQTQTVAPAKPGDATPPARAAAQPIADTCDAPEVLEGIARGLQQVQHLPERAVPRERFTDLQTLARTDDSIECGVTLAAGPHADDIRAGRYHVEYRGQAAPQDGPDSASSSQAEDRTPAGD